MYLITENNGKKVSYSKLTVVGKSYNVSIHTLRASRRKMVKRGLDWRFVSSEGVIIEEIQNGEQ